MIPAFINSPQFFNLAISKSNRLLAVFCCMYAILAAAASLHCACNSLSSGLDHVADTPSDKVKLSF